MNQAREELIRHADAGTLSAGALALGLRLAGATPDAGAWRRFLDRLLLIAGALLIAVGVIFFIAYNWQAMGRFFKFAMLEALVLLPALYAWVAGRDSVKGRAALLFAVLIEGALLALLGQTYQTGADNYELFVAWALLALPWVVAGSWAPLWALWWTLVNLALALYLSLELDPWRILFFGRLRVSGFAFLNLAGLLAFEWAYAAWAPLRTRWLARYCVLLVLAPTAVAAVLYVMGERADDYAIGLALYCAAIGGGAWFYQRRCRDLFPLAFGVLSLIVVLTCWLGRNLLRFDSDVFGGFALLALLVIGASAGATWWLRELNRKWRKEPA